MQVVTRACLVQSHLKRTQLKGELMQRRTLRTAHESATMTGPFYDRIAESRAGTPPVSFGGIHQHSFTARYELQIQ